MVSGTKVQCESPFNCTLEILLSLLTNLRLRWRCNALQNAPQLCTC